MKTFHEWASENDMYSPDYEVAEKAWNAAIKSALGAVDQALKEHPEHWTKNHLNVVLFNTVSLLKSE